MANIGDPITPSVPPVGAAGPQYATDIDAILNEVVARLTVKVPLSSVNFNNNLDLAGSDLLNAANITLTTQGGAPTGSPFNRFASFGGNLYWVNALGAVQITNGASLNASSLAGITGDYGGANPAQLNYVAVDTRYNFYSNFSTGTWAYARALGFDVAGGASSTAFARILWGGSSNITLTLPTVLPGANQILSVDNTGAITAGTSTALATNNSITVSGTGVYKHASKSIYRITDFKSAHVVSGTGSFGATLGTGVGAGEDLRWQLPPLPNFCRILNVTVTFSTLGGRNGCTCTLYSTSTADPAGTTFTSVTTMSNAGTAKSSATGVNLTPGTNQTYWVGVSGTGAGGTVVNMAVDFDVP